MSRNRLLVLTKGVANMGHSMDARFSCCQSPPSKVHLQVSDWPGIPGCALPPQVLNERKSQTFRKSKSSTMPIVDFDAWIECDSTAKFPIESNDGADKRSNFASEKSEILNSKNRLQSAIIPHTRRSRRQTMRQNVSSRKSDEKQKSPQSKKRNKRPDQLAARKPCQRTRPGSIIPVSNGNETKMNNLANMKKSSGLSHSTRSRANNCLSSSTQTNSRNLSKSEHIQTCQHKRADSGTNILSSTSNHSRGSIARRSCRRTRSDSALRPASRSGAGTQRSSRSPSKWQCHGGCNKDSKLKRLSRAREQPRQMGPRYLAETKDEDVFEVVFDVPF